MAAATASREGDVLYVTLTRPETRNAFDEATISELTAILSDVGDARALVLRGEGPSFCAGADIAWMRALGAATREANATSARALRTMFEALDGCAAPVVVAAHGHALGGGVGLVACADVALAQRDTVFAFSEVKLGIIPSVISPFAIRKIGESHARRLFVTGERFDAAEALRIGLVHQVADDLDDALARVLAELRSAGPQATRVAKRLVLERPDGEATVGRIVAARASAEGQEGLAAFLERRRPRWTEVDGS